MTLASLSGLSTPSRPRTALRTHRLRFKPACPPLAEDAADTDGPSWGQAAPILLFLAGMILMRLGAAEITGDTTPPPADRPQLARLAGD